jgi:alkaline phosphatase D
MKNFISIGKGVVLLLSILLVFNSCKVTTETKRVEETYLVVLSLDGFRWDYPNMYETPWLDSIAKIGIRAEGLMPAFPTKTFPNHYTIATGLHPGHHGLVQNSFYAPDLDLFYQVSDRKMVEDHRFYGGEPIWTTAEKQGVTTANLFWVGSEVNSSKGVPSIRKKYDHHLPFSQRVDSVIHWLSLSQEIRPRFVMTYMHEPDAVGHSYGPYSNEVAQKVALLDSLVGDLYTKLNKLPIAGMINLVVTSDHGMGAIDSSRSIYLKGLLKESWIARHEGSNPVYMLDANAGCVDSIGCALSGIKHISWWKKEEIPSELCYNHQRVKDFVLVADSAWSLYWEANSSGYFKGTHGYLPSNKDMHAIFYATGPAFKQGSKVPVFQNIELYGLFARVLGLKAAETDGEINHIEEMLQ